MAAQPASAEPVTVGTVLVRWVLGVVAFAVIAIVAATAVGLAAGAVWALFLIGWEVFG